MQRLQVAARVDARLGWYKFIVCFKSVSEVDAERNFTLAIFGVIYITSPEGAT
jgi:hypothetical protein